MAEGQRLANIKAVKQMWCRSPGSKMPKPLEWIGQAPSSIDEFKDTFPHVYGTVFAEAGPRKMPMSEIDWNMLVSGTRCRQSAGTCTAQVTAMMAQGTSSHALSAPAGVPGELT